MAFSLASITREAAYNAPRIAIWGKEKIGKTTFACTGENTIVIPIAGETGLDGLNVAKFPTITTFAELIDAIGVLAQDEHTFDKIVIDSATAAEKRIIWPATCARNGVETIEKVLGGFGKGYTEALKEWQMVLDGLDFLRNQKQMTAVIIGHVEIKEINDPSTEPYTAYVPSLHKSATAMVNQWADSVLFASPQIVTRKVSNDDHRATQLKERVLYTQPRPHHPGGGRHVYGKLPYEMPLSWNNYIETINQLIATERN
jgi:hypothetical protein